MEDYCRGSHAVELPRKNVGNPHCLKIRVDHCNPNIATVEQCSLFGGMSK